MYGIDECSESVPFTFYFAQLLNYRFLALTRIGTAILKSTFGSLSTYMCHDLY